MLNLAFKGIKPFKVLSCCGFFLVTLSGCNWLFLNLSAYSDYVHSAVDPTSFGDTKFDQAINPYNWDKKPGRFFGDTSNYSANPDGPPPQFAGYSSEIKTRVFAKAQSVFSEDSSHPQILDEAARSGGKCVRKEKETLCTIKKIIWELDTDTGTRATINSNALCITFTLLFPVKNVLTFDEITFEIQKHVYYLQRQNNAARLMETCS